MLIIFNYIGAGILLLAFVLGAVVASLFGAKTSAPTMLFGGVFAVVLDLAYRMKVGEGSLLHPRRGGHVFFIPAWILGFGLLMSGGSGVLFPENKSASSQESRQGVQPYGLQTSADPRGAYPAIPVQAPPSYEGLKLTMISGTGQHRVATINGEPFAAGEAHKLRVAQRKVTVTCVEIRDQSVIAKVTGESYPRELKFGEPTTLAATP